MNWKHFTFVDVGSVSYSAMQFLSKQNSLEILYKRSNLALIFEPDEIVYWKVF